ncbi:MAG: Ig-like domain-containing protein [Burkholderiaceae bacterium]
MALVAAMVSACGGGGGGGATPAPAPNAPASISFGPATLAVAPGGRLFLVATAHFSEGRSEDVTRQGSWVSLSPSVATVGAADGVVVGVAEGQTGVRITYNGVSAVAQLRVGSILSAIDMGSFDQLGIGVGATFQFAALGQFTDGARDITGVAAWASSDPAVASVSGGMVTGLTAGDVVITVRSDGLSTSVALTIPPIQTLAQVAAQPVLGLQLGGLGVDAAGRSLAVWNYRFAQAGAADLFMAKQSAATGWTPATALRTVSKRELSSAPRLAMNTAGLAVMAWHQIDGLYAAMYSPLTGWRAPEKIATQALEDPDLQLELGIDDAGNALATWKADGSAGFESSVWRVASSQWSAPALVPGSNPPASVPFQARLVMGASGGAALAWTRFRLTGPAPTSGTHELLASKWVSGEGPGTGWQAPELMLASPSLPELAIAGNAVGDAAVAWIVSEPNPTPGTQDPFLGSIASRRVSASGVWSSTQTIATGLTRQPHQPMMAMNIQGNAVLAWRNAFDVSISTALLGSGGTWGAPLDLYRPNVLQAGDPTVLKPSMTDDGRALVPWVVADNGLLGQVATARYLPGAGWEQGQLLTYTGRLGLVVNVDIEFNREGQGAIFWLESSGAGFNLYGKGGLSF